MDYPLSQTVDYRQASLFAQAIDDEEAVVYLHSARQDAQLGRYSFLALEPVTVWRGDDLSDGSCWQRWRDCLAHFSLKTDSTLPPFQGGLAGYVSYDAGALLQGCGAELTAGLALPAWCMGVFDVVLSYDHHAERAWVVSTGYPEQSSSLRRARAQARLHALVERVESAQERVMSVNPYIPAAAIQRHFSRTEYLAAIARAQAYIRAGDIFEVNIAQCCYTLRPQHFSPLALFHRLCRDNAAPFAAYLRFGEAAIVSSSPERFLQVRGDKVEARPIKGTRPRSLDPQEDEAIALELLASEKDRAENVMIVDLMRNDLSKVCLPHSVAVPQCCGLESYETVHHLVSVITGRLAPDQDVIGLLQASLPGGSITGAPKIRSMQIIAELERRRRDAYCGNALYLGFDGALDSSILIRTIVADAEQLSFHAGGAIVLDSDPQMEYDETMTKWAPLWQALTGEAMPLLDEVML